MEQLLRNPRKARLPEKLIRGRYRWRCIMRYDRMGVEFIKIAAFLQIARYICVALMGPGKQGAWEPSLSKIAYQWPWFAEA